jgi:hypothetical protein
MFIGYAQDSKAWRFFTWQSGKLSVIESCHIKAFFNGARKNGDIGWPPRRHVIPRYATSCHVSLSAENILVRNQGGISRSELTSMFSCELSLAPNRPKQKPNFLILYIVPFASPACASHRVSEHKELSSIQLTPLSLDAPTAIHSGRLRASKLLESSIYVTSFATAP